jgi:uncharacterized phage protein gp47/JayE
MTDTSFSRPTLPQIRQRILNDLKSGMDGVDAFLRRSFVYVYGVSLSGLVHGMYGYLDWIARQHFVDTAEADQLDRHATFWLKTGRKAATKATGTATFSGDNGMAVNIGTKLQSASGIDYVTTSAGVIAGGTLTLTIEAVVPGLGGNLDAGASLICISPIAGVQAIATSGTIASGNDIESDDDLRERVLSRVRQPPHGGAEFDYIAWAKEVSGVTRAWAKFNGPGKVILRFMMDDTYPDGIPEAADVSTVQTYIDPIRPLGVKAFEVVAPVAVPLDFTILLKDEDGNTVTSADVRANVTAELKDLIRREAEPGKTMLLSKIREAISTAIGEYDHNITVPAGDVTYAGGQITTMGTITWAL